MIQRLSSLQDYLSQMKPHLEGIFMAWMCFLLTWAQLKYWEEPMHHTYLAIVSIGTLAVYLPACRNALLRMKWTYLLGFSVLGFGLLLTIYGVERWILGLMAPTAIILLYFKQIRNLPNLRKLPGLKSFVIPLIWVLVTYDIPVSPMKKDLATNYYLAWYFLVFLMCLLTDYLDAENDRSEGLRTLANNFSKPWLSLIGLFVWSGYLYFGIQSTAYGHSTSLFLAVLLSGVYIFLVSIFVLSDNLKSKIAIDLCFGIYSIPLLWTNLVY